MRNLDKELFCKKLTCVDESHSCFVFWTTKKPGLHRELLMGLPSKDMTEWFRKTPIERTYEITSNMIKKSFSR